MNFQTLAGVGASSAYIVTEKVHGANFSIIAAFDAHGGPVVHFAKRTAILGGAHNAEDFYICRSTGLLRDKYIYIYIHIYILPDAYCLCPDYIKLISYRIVILPTRLAK